MPMSGADRANIKTYFQKYGHVYSKSKQRGERAKKYNASNKILNCFIVTHEINDDRKHIVNGRTAKEDSCGMFSS